MINIHEFLIKDVILYFEKNRSVRKRVKEARKTIKKALRYGRKKKVYPSDKTDRALELMEDLLEEVNYTHQVLQQSAIEMEGVITRIKEERVEHILSLISTARECFRKNELEKGVRLLNEAQSGLEEKFLLKTRKAFLTGIDSQIKKLKREIEAKKE